MNHVSSSAFFSWALFFFLTSASSLQAADISKLMAASKAVVKITAESGGLRKAPAESALDPATGQILTRQPIQAFHAQNSGGGVIVDPSGLIVTNAHTLQMAMRIAVTFQDGTTLPAALAHVQAEDDLVLLRVEAGKELPWLPLADSDALSLGNAVYSLGSSAFLSRTLSEGSLSGLAQRKDDPDHTAVLRINFKVYPGDSGSPVLNDKGEIVGITVAGQTTGNQETYAIASNRLQKALTAYRKKQES